MTVLCRDRSHRGTSRELHDDAITRRGGLMRRVGPLVLGSDTDPALTDSLGVADRHRPRASKVTLALSDRLSDLSVRCEGGWRVWRLARRIRECALNEYGWRCDHPVCPRCSARKAKKYRERIERELRALRPGVRVYHLTLTRGDDTIVGGRKRLLKAFRLLRRRHSFGQVLGGSFQVEVLPTNSGSMKWNVHLHAVIFSSSRHLPLADMRAAWLEIAGVDDVPGSLCLSLVQPFPRSDRGSTKGFSPVAFYTTKRRRSELLAFSDLQLREFVASVPGRRWMFRFGSAHRGSCKQQRLST